eukprot:TRINITY_DN46863_c0_g1_i1.p2 TRINITY_DN46863_c0_g1~~TRINITY_DN46863_c0_g1_i1.p2  ORF type:complete len:262 (+),score=33.28 TRINITY_DN46863_c0_g1_i1:68-853(+)
MAVDDSVGVLIGMCCGFFVITVVALLLYLRQQDLIRLKDSAITEMERLERDWEAERQILQERAARDPGPARDAPGDTDKAPPLPAQESCELAPLDAGASAGLLSSAAGAPISKMERRWLRKQTASRLLRLSADTRYRIIRLSYNKWLRFLVARLGAAGMVSPPHPALGLDPAGRQRFYQPSLGGSPTPRWHGAREDGFSAGGFDGLPRPSPLPAQLRYSRPPVQLHPDFGAVQGPPAPGSYSSLYGSPAPRFAYPGVERRR